MNNTLMVSSSERKFTIYACAAVFDEIAGKNVRKEM